MRTMLALTPGDPAGIGPDITVMLAAQNQLQDVVVFADPDLLDARAKQLGIRINILGIKEEWNIKGLRVYPVRLKANVISGQPSPQHATYILQTLEIAADHCLNNKLSGLVTGPVNKAVINQAGIPFTGHTEWLRDHCKSTRTVMMLSHQNFRVALVTTHLPLREVPDAITQANILETVNILQQELSDRFAIRHPRIAVCGLNPHAGESGHIGQEEITIIKPAIEKLLQQGLQVDGPVAADSIFAHRNLDMYDAVVAMYHDQGLGAVKAVGFGGTVNITLGLPIVRTSVDHGTAYSLAGTGDAKPDSLSAALNQALRLARNKRALEQQLEHV